MGIELNSNQLDAIDRLRSGSILWGGVGSGKSRTALAYLYFRELDGQVPVNGLGGFKRPKHIKLYVITTAHKRDLAEWELEARFFPELDMTVDSWNNIAKYQDITGAFFIFDEQRVVGYGTWAKAFIRIAKHNRWIMLSATPGDTWMDYVSVFIANGYFKNKSEFLRKHVVFSRFSKYPKVERYVDVAHLTKYRDSILIYLSSSNRAIQRHQIVWVSYDKETTNRVIKDRWNIFNKEPLRDAGEACLLLRRIANTDKSRIDACRSLLESSKKAIVFYSFNYELDILREICESISIPYAEWNGHKHEQIPDTNRWAYLVQYTAGCEGWNCISTDTMIFYSQTYSYKVMKQAAGRIDRINTPFRELQYYHLVSRSPIDIAIQKAINAKQTFNESAFYTKKFF